MFNCCHMGNCIVNVLILNPLSFIGVINIFRYYEYCEKIIIINTLMSPLSKYSYLHQESQISHVIYYRNK